MLSAFVHGVILAFGLILPLGVQNVFIFNQGAGSRRFVRALPVIVTAAVCDTLLICLAVLGVSVVLLGSYWLKTVLISAGVLFLLFMGWSTWKSPVRVEPSGNTQEAAPDAAVGQLSEGGTGRPLSARRQIAFAASVSLLNPHAILDTVGVIGTSSLSYESSGKLAFTLGAIFVSWSWFTGLAAVGRVTGTMDRSGHAMKLFNKLSALFMWGSAAYLLLQIPS